MQTLTKRDIEYFVKAEFETSPAFQDLRDVFGDDAVSLLKEITEKADGVFLWVGLVVKSLLSILVDTPSLPYLYEKLDEIPNDIIGMYTSIWRSIPPERLATASKIFQLRKTSILTLEAEVCWLVTEGVSTADAIKDPKAREGIQKVMKRVLEGHTRGICELSRGNIQFLHRSAAEWMQEKAMWAEICSKAPDDFESNLSLLEATVLHPLANKDHLFRSYSYFAELCFYHLSVMFYHAYSAYASPLCQSDSSRKKRIARALDAMIGMVREDFTELRKDNVSNGDRVVNSTPQSLTVFSTQSWVAVGPPSGWLDLEIFFVGLAAWQGLVDYVKQKVTLDNGLLVAKPNRVSILEQAIFPNVEALRHSRSPANILLVMSGFREERLEIIKFILKMSKTRYQTWNGLPMWHMVEDALASPRISEYDQEKSEWLKKVLVILEEHGYRNNSNSVLGQGDRKKTGVWQRFKAKLKPAKDV
ncbi:hypothetical protein AK830_g4642 [Neonectria ditissima]|uniref:Uncharacterized protein n=1 Tax=Neonectria ditissima TaxID=78410 RepID=A0A0P7BNC2_9HYPO|nr:hypothetical protein AK830_g4642 [Neonectria ditissima]